MYWLYKAKGEKEKKRCTENELGMATIKDWSQMMVVMMVINIIDGAGIDVTLE